LQVCGRERSVVCLYASVVRFVLLVPISLF
jgi:hypothetical protein